MICDIASQHHHIALDGLRLIAGNFKMQIA
jgi:hypothetical protein